VRGNHGYIVIARLKPEIDMKKAQSEMDTISTRLGRSSIPRTSRLGRGGPFG